MSNKFHATEEQKINYLQAIASAPAQRIASYYEIEDHLLNTALATPVQIMENQRNPMWCGLVETEQAPAQIDDRLIFEEFAFFPSTTKDLLDGTGELLLQPIVESMDELRMTQSIEYMPLSIAIKRLFDSGEDEQQQQLDKTQMTSTTFPIAVGEENERETSPNISQHTARDSWHSGSDSVVRPQEHPGKMKEKHDGKKEQTTDSSAGNEQKIKVKEPVAGTSKASNVKISTNATTNQKTQEKGKIVKGMVSQSYSLNSVDDVDVEMKKESEKNIAM